MKEFGEKKITELDKSVICITGSEIIFCSLE